MPFNLGIKVIHGGVRGSVGSVVHPLQDRLHLYDSFMATFWTQHLSQNSTHGQKSSWPWRRSCGWAPPSSDLSTCLLRPLLFYNNITSSGVLSAPLPLLLAQEEDP
eukprot:1178426-Prorocentrum_minimum.AAC.3